MKLIQKIFGSENDRTLKRYRRLVVRINELEPQMEQLQDADFPNKTEEYQKRCKDGEALDDLLPEAFALVREAARRVIGERHYDVQLIGGIALHEGNIANWRRKNPRINLPRLLERPNWTWCACDHAE